MNKELQIALIRNDLNVTKIAFATGYSVSHVSNILRGRDPNETISKYLDSKGINLEELLKAHTDIKPETKKIAS